MPCTSTNYTGMTIQELYTDLNTKYTSDVNNDTKYGDMLECVQKRIIDANANLNNLLNVYEDDKLNAITASELNTNTQTLYQTDLYYTYGKVLLFACLFGIYFYFFKISGIIEPLKNGLKNIKEKANKLTDVKMPEIKSEIKIPTNKNK